MGAGWVCVVMADRGNLELEQLDDAGSEWYGTGPDGEHMGQIREVIEQALGDPSPDPAWLAVVLHELARDGHLIGGRCCSSSVRREPGFTPRSAQTGSRSRATASTGLE